MSNIRVGSPFRAALIMAAAIGAALQAHHGDYAGQQAALKQIGPYQGRGKGRTKTHDRGGTRAAQRAAKKRRNQIRHHKACRG